MKLNKKEIKSYVNMSAKSIALPRQPTTTLTSSAIETLSSLPSESESVVRSLPPPNPKHIEIVEL